MYKSGEHGLPIEKESKLDRGIENYPKSKSYSMGHTEFAKQRNYGKDDHEGFYTQRNISASPFIQEPKCKCESFELNSLINEIVLEFQEIAKNSPRLLSNLNTQLLVYWPEDKVWYHCSVRGFNPVGSKFDLLYDDGVQETVTLYEECFISLEKFKQIKHKLVMVNPSSTSNHMQMHEHLAYPHWYYQHQEMRAIKTDSNEMYLNANKMTTPEVIKDTAKIKTIKPPEKVVIDEFTIIAREYDDSSDDSFLSNNKSEDYNEKIMFSQPAMDDQRKSKINGFCQLADYSGASGPKTNKNSKEKDYQQQDHHTFSLEDDSNYVIKSGPFNISKFHGSKDIRVNDSLRIEKEENDQIALALVKQYCKNHIGVLDSNEENLSESNFRKPNGLNPTNKYQISQSINPKLAECMLSCRHKQFLPTSFRLKRDMKAFEKKFYERYMSCGYKQCECRVCETLELKFLIKSDRDPDDFQDLHNKYLQRKINKEKIKMLL